MKKLFKSISVFVLSLSLAFSSIAFVQTTKADEVSDWKASAVITPAKDSLVGAGYISVEFDNSMSGYEYEVFLDGNPIYWNGNDIVRTEIGEEVTESSIRKTFTSADDGKTEVYTNQVKKHEITVKATKGGNTITSDARTFYVSRKGMAMGDDMGNKMQLKKLNCSWYYNWNSFGFHNAVDDSVSHMPMIWGGPEEEIQKQVDELEPYSNYVLGFNEPDIKGQANMKWWDASKMWKQYVSPINMRKVSPAPASPGGNSDWLKRFVNGEDICELPNGKWDDYYWYADEPSITPVHVDAVEDCDAVCLHSYQSKIDAAGLISAVNNLWRNFHKPIWITEIGLFGRKSDPNTDMSYENAEKRAKIQQFMETVVTELEKLPYVERYCWFSYDVESANAIDDFDGSGGTSMFEYSTGLYTDLGKSYSNIANPSGYSAYSISNNETFDWDNRVKYEVSYNQPTDTATVSWTKGALSFMPKVEIFLDDDEENPIAVENGGQIDVSALSEGKHSVKYVVYDENNQQMVTKTRSFVIDRAAVPTSTDVPTTMAPTTRVTPTTVVPTTQNKTTAKPDEPAITDKQPESSVAKPGKVSLKAKNIKKKSVKLSWSPVSGAKKYRVQWALNKKFTKSKKSKTVTKAGYKATKLKKKKTYFFRVAALNEISIGPWSSIKKIRIKK